MSTTLMVAIIVVLLLLIIVQISRIADASARVRGEEQSRMDGNNWSARLFPIFGFVFLASVVGSAVYYAPFLLGSGRLPAASIHGAELDSIFNITLLFTGVVFFATQIALFWFAYKYREQPGRRALFISHDNRLELVWTVIPAIVMALLVVGGLEAWNTTMADVPEEAVPGEDYIEIEATGYQFAWDLRYPGADNVLGRKNFKLITGTNSLGQDFTDAKNIDDFTPDRIVLPVGKTVRVRITAKDVLHNFYLPHFRVKMDAIPGLPTYFVFTPTQTTEDYRQNLRQYAEWQEPADPNDPEGAEMWEVFNFELACAELCGRGHWNMRRIVEIVTEEEYKEWLVSQEELSPYLMNVRGKPNDPHADVPVGGLKLEQRIAARKMSEKGVEDNVPEDAMVPREDTDADLDPIEGEMEMGM